MSSESQPIDHFSDEAQQRYTVHTAAREALATLGAQVAVSGTRGPIDTMTSKYLGAVRGTTGMYVASYRKQSQYDKDIATKLLPRVGDELRLYGETELKIAKTIPGFSPDLQKYLSYRNEIDRSAVDAEIERVAGLPLDLAVDSAIARLGTVIVAHIGDFVR